MATKTGRSPAVKAAARPVAQSLPEAANLSTKERLERYPGSFAFAQAIRLVRETLELAGVKNASDAILYRVNPNLSFPPRDIQRITFSGKGAGMRAEVVMNLMGLHGAASPLPAYFTEHVAKNQDERDALRDFFDIFNNRLTGLLYAAWNKYRYYLQYKDGASDKLSSQFLGFIGLGSRLTRGSKRLDHSKLLAYAGLIAFKGDAAGSLESTLQNYFSHPHVKVIPCIRRTVRIHADQLTRLGKMNSRLSESSILGGSMQDQTGKFRISISRLHWDRFNSFLPDKDIFTELSTLVRFVLSSRLKFDVELRLRPEEIRPLKLAGNSVNRLGWSSWLGEKGDGVVLLESSIQE